MKKRKWIPALFVYILLLFALLFLPSILGIAPSLDRFRNYYNIVSSIISSLVGVTGIILGLFYYFDKERRTKTKILKKSIEEYDCCVKQILKLQVSDDEELKKLRIKIDSLNDSINIMLDNSIDFIQLSDDKISEILRINSIIDKSEVVMRLSFKELTQADRASVFDIYEKALREVLLVCYKELS